MILRIERTSTNAKTLDCWSAEYDCSIKVPEIVNKFNQPTVSVKLKSPWMDSLTMTVPEPNTFFQLSTI